MRNILAISFYRDRAGKEFDAERFAQNRAQVKPVDDFMDLVSKQTELALSAPVQERGRLAGCVLAWLDSWAQADALLGEMSPQGTAHRRWVANALAVDFLAVSGLAPDDPAARMRIRQWFQRIGHEIIATMGRQRNNHLYWAGAATTAISVIAGDAALMDWGVAQARRGLSEVSSDGTLPNEVSRGARALSYHVYSLSPLLQIVYLARANGVTFTPAEMDALKRLKDLVVRNLADSAELTRKAQAAQEMKSDSDFALAWTRTYATVFSDADCDVIDLIPTTRTIRYSYLGGNVNLLYPATTRRSCPR